MSAVLGEINVKPEHVSDLTETTNHDPQGTVSDEPGVLQFHILTDVDIPNRFHYIDIFRDVAAADTQCETENFKTWRATVNDILIGEIQRISTMRPIFPSDQALEQQDAGLVDW
jgi:quinol monooxygenase YgiN